MATKILKSIKGRRARITKVNATTGAYVVGSCAQVVTEGFIKITLAGEIEKGKEYTSQNAWGDFCISEKDGDRLKWTNVTVSFCEVNPDVADIIGGEAITPIVVGMNTIGFSVGPEVNTEAFAIEVWTKASGNADNTWGFFLAPMIVNGHIDGDIAIENGPLTFTVKGEAQENVAWGTGAGMTPDNPLLASFPIGKQWAMVTTTVAPPAATPNCVALT